VVRSDLDALEDYLVRAPVAQTLSHSLGGGGHPSGLAVLEGGVAVLVKPENATVEAPAMIRRERAAWVLARSLGWTDMVVSTDDLWRAGMFDAVVRHTDRHPGNWLAVPREPGHGQQRLKLVDHGHAFDLGRALLSPFYDRLRGQPIPAEHADALNAVDLADLDELLSEMSSQLLSGGWMPFKPALWTSRSPENASKGV